MKIVNIDAPREFERVFGHLRILEFVSVALRPLEREYYDHFSLHLIGHGGYSHGELPSSPIWQFDEVGYENIAALLHAIPIYLRDQRPEVRGENKKGASGDERRKAEQSRSEAREERPIKKLADFGEPPIRDSYVAEALSRLGEDERPRRREVESVDKNGIVDLLGAYFTSRNGNSPYVELYLTDIAKASRGDDREFAWLFTTVLIHELAHAALDVHNWERPVTEKVLYSSEFGRWREESMANAVTLEIINRYCDRNFYDYAKRFMQSQPAEYALGVLMEDLAHLDFSNVFEAKYHGVDSRLQQDWLDYVKGNPDKAGLEKRRCSLMYSDVYLFEGDYYVVEGRLVYAIVKKIISDYEKKNGSKMPFATFSSLFPCFVLERGKNGYEPISNVKASEGFLYRSVFTLQEGDYALYRDWFDSDWQQFKSTVNFGKLGIKVEEYKNW